MIPTTTFESCCSRIQYTNVGRGKKSDGLKLCYLSSDGAEEYKQGQKNQHIFDEIYQIQIRQIFY